MSNADDPEALEADVQRLKAQRDELEAQTAKLDRRAHGGRVRHIVVGVLVVLTCLSFLTASVGFWAHRNLLSTDVWVERVGPLASDPAVQKALAAQITDQAMTAINPQELFESVLPDKGKLLAVPLAGAVRNFVGSKVLQFVESDTFAKIWTEANRVAHRDAVKTLRGESPSKSISTSNGKIVISMIPAIDAILQRISLLSPDLFGHKIKLPKVTVNELPAEAQKKISDALGIKLDKNFGVITVYDGDKLSASQTALKWFDRLFVGSLILTVVLLAVTLTVSRRRRRTGLQLLVGFALVLVLVRRIALRAVEDVLDLVKIPVNKTAVHSILHAFVDPLLNSTQWILTGFAVAIAILLVTGPYRWAVALRRGVVDLARGTVHVAKGTVSAAGDAATAEPTVAWLVAHAKALQWGGGALFLAALWWWDLSWFGLLLLAILIGAFEFWVYRLVPADEAEGDDGESGVSEPPATPTVV